MTDREAEIRAWRRRVEGAQSPYPHRDDVDTLLALLGEARLAAARKDIALGGTLGIEHTDAPSMAAAVARIIAERDALRLSLDETRRERDAMRAVVEAIGCTDGYCRFRPENLKGMHTQGGCRCVASINDALRAARAKETP